MISELNRRRIANFKANRRGLYSLIIFLVLFLISLCAEIICNDKPVVISYEKKLYFPFIKSYPETVFGGDFDTEADYHDPAIAGSIKDHGWVLWPLVKYRYDTINFSYAGTHPSPPSAENLLGTDDRGRDVLARVIYGFRISILFGLCLAVLSSLIGILAGLLQGYLGGLTDLLMQRFIEIWSSVPTLFLLLILASIIQPSFWILLGFTLLFSWMGLVGLVRAEVLKVRNFDYVMAARSLGVSESKIMLRHVLPNSLVSTLTYLPFIISGAITTLTSLDFLGLGLPSGSPSLGEVLAQGKANLQAPWLGLTGFFTVGFILSLLVFIGEAARDAFSPNKLFRN